MKEAFFAWLFSWVGLVTCVLLLLNLFTFFAYGWDKWMAKREGARRTPEKTLISLAVCGGSIGALLGMKIWHHKTLHKKFSIGLPVILTVQVVVIGGLWIYWNFFH